MKHIYNTDVITTYGLVEEIDPQTWEVIRPLPW